jgi:hypothetical protein
MGKLRNSVGNIAIPHIQEARRYLDNAKEILSEKAGKSGKFYSDKKYVRMAGNTAWSGILEALDGTFEVRERNQRPDVKKYQQAIGKRSASTLKLFNVAYDTLHKALGYDGNLTVSIVQTGLSQADDLISWCENNS